MQKIKDVISYVQSKGNKVRIGFPLEMEASG